MLFKEKKKKNTKSSSMGEIETKIKTLTKSKKLEQKQKNIQKAKSCSQKIQSKLTLWKSTSIYFEEVIECICENFTA